MFNMFSAMLAAGGRPAAMPSSTHDLTLPDISALQQQVVAGLAALGFHVIAPGARNATEAGGVGAGA